MNELNATRLELVEEALASNDLAKAAALCQIVLSAAPEDAAAFYGLGRIGLRVGAKAQAARYLRLSAAAGHSDAEKSLAALGGEPPRETFGAAPRYLLIKAWGYGFWAEVSHVLGGLLLAEITGRQAVVHWGSNCLFGDGGDGDNFTRYFRAPSTTTVTDLANLPNPDFFPAAWNSENLAVEHLNKKMGDESAVGAMAYLARPERVIVAEYFLSVAALAPWLPDAHPLAGRSIEAIHRALIGKYLFPADDIASYCDAFYARHLSGGPYAAIHLRGFEKMMEAPRLLTENGRAMALIETLPKDLPIFLLTDDDRYVEMMKHMVGGRLILTDSERVPADDEVRSVHHTPGDGVQRGRDMLRDSLLAVRAQYFVGNGNSNVAALIAMLKPWSPRDCELVTTPVCLRPRATVRLAPEIAGNDLVPGYDRATQIWRPTVAESEIPRTYTTGAES